MVRQFLIELGVLLAVMAAISLAAGVVNFALPTSPSPTATHPVASTPASPSPTSTPAPTKTPTPEPTPSYVPLPPPVQFTISGRGPGNSGQFELPALFYVINYTLGGRCQYSGTINSTDGTYSNTWALSRTYGTDSWPITGPTGGSTNLYLNLPGAYFVAMSSGPDCPWSLTFVPQSPAPQSFVPS